MGDLALSVSTFFSLLGEYGEHVGERMCIILEVGLDGGLLNVVARALRCEDAAAHRCRDTSSSGWER